MGGGQDSAAFHRFVAFHWDSTRGRGHLTPIPNPASFDLSDLLGADEAVAQLVRNTRQFLAGLPFNNVLLYGERGTGKSSSVRGILRRHAAVGLRVVEVDKADLVHLPRVLSAIRELKAALEGSLAGPPENVCIIATSNRRHLVPETIADDQPVRLDEKGELHLGEALADRFGLVIGFYSFDQKTYLAIVEHYLERVGTGGALSDDLRRDALKWALGRSSRSGRTAQ